MSCRIKLFFLNVCFWMTIIFFSNFHFFFRVGVSWGVPGWSILEYCDSRNDFLMPILGAPKALHSTLLITTSYLIKNHTENTKKSIHLGKEILALSQHLPHILVLMVWPTKPNKTHIEAKTVQKKRHDNFGTFTFNKWQIQQPQN